MNNHKSQQSQLVWSVYQVFDPYPGSTEKSNPAADPSVSMIHQNLKRNFPNLYNIYIYIYMIYIWYIYMYKYCSSRLQICLNRYLRYASARCLFTIPQWAQPPISWLGSATKFRASKVWVESELLLWEQPQQRHTLPGKPRVAAARAAVGNHQGSMGPWFSQFVQVPTRRCCWCCQRMDRPKGKAFRSAAWGWNFINVRWQ